MTSMPASRRARAIIFAPLSWPSRPGLATRTRIGKLISDCGPLVVCSEHTAQRAANLAQCGVGANGVDQRRHQVAFLSARRRAAKRIELLPDIFIITCFSQFAQLVNLP